MVRRRLFALFACAPFGVGLAGIDACTTFGASPSAASGDAANLGRQEDASVLDEAGAEAGAGTLCQPQVANTLLCDDFEGRVDASDLTGGKWNAERVSATTGQLDIFPDRGGHVLRATVADADAGGSAFALLVKSTPEPVSTFHVRLKLWIDSYAAAGQSYQTVAIASDHDATSSGTIGLVVMDQKVQLVEQVFLPGVEATYTAHDLVRPLTVGVWHDIDLQLTFGGAPSASLLVDDTPFYAANVAPFFTPAVTTFRGGIPYAMTPIAHHAFEIDDVLIQAN